MGSTSSFTSILLPVFLSLKQPIPLSVRSFSTLSDVFTVLILSSFGCLSLPSGSIVSIPSSSRTSLQMSGGESIFPLITKNLVLTPLVLFLMVTGNSSLTSSLLCRARIFSLLGASSDLLRTVFECSKLVFVHYVDTGSSKGGWEGFESGI